MLDQSNGNPDNNASHYKFRYIWKRAVKKITINNMMRRLLYCHTMVVPPSKKYKTIDDFELTRRPRRLIMPHSRGKSFWDMYIGLTLLYTGIFTPFIISFLETSYWDPWFIIDIILDFSFLTDVACNLNTAYYDKDRVLIQSRKLIFLNYLKGWLVLDFIASIPIGLIEYIITGGDASDSTRNANNLIKILRFRSITRFLKLSKLGKIFKHYNNTGLMHDLQGVLNLNNSSFRVLKMIFHIVLSLHIVACVWRLQANFYQVSWYSIYEYDEHSLASQYLASVYWAVTTVSTVGYGDITPQNDAERLIALLWMIAGIYIVSFTISSLSSIIAEMDTKEILIKKRLNLIDIFAVSKKLPKKLIKDLQNYVTECPESKKITFKDQVKFIKGLPQTLKNEIAVNMYNGCVAGLTFFSECDSMLLGHIIPLLKLKSYYSKEPIFVKGEPALSIYFVMTGGVNYVYGDKSIIFFSVMHGDYFGAYETLKYLRRNYNCVAGLKCSLLVMKEAVIDKLRSMFPRRYADIEKESEIKEENLASNLIKMKLSIQASKDGTLSELTSREINNRVKLKLNERKAKEAMDKPLSARDYAEQLKTLMNIIAETNAAIKRIEESTVNNTYNH